LMITERGNTLRFSGESVARIIIRDGGACLACGRPASDIAHYVRRSQGGLGVPQNGGCMCRSCHCEYDSRLNEGLADTFREHLRAHYESWDMMRLVQLTAERR